MSFKLLQDDTKFEISFFDDDYVSSLKKEIEKVISKYKNNRVTQVELKKIITSEIKCANGYKLPIPVKSNIPVHDPDKHSIKYENINEALKLSSDEYLRENYSETRVRLQNYVDYLLMIIKKLQMGNFDSISDTSQDSSTDSSTDIINDFRSKHYDLLKKAMQKGLLYNDEDEDLRTLQRGIAIDDLISFLLIKNQADIRPNEFHYYFLKDGKIQYSEKYVRNAFSSISSDKNKKVKKERKKT